MYLGFYLLIFLIYSENRLKWQVDFFSDIFVGKVVLVYIKSLLL